MYMHTVFIIKYMAISPTLERGHAMVDKDLEGSCVKVQEQGFPFSV